MAAPSTEDARLGAAVRVTWLGALANLALGGLKAVVGLAGGSAVLVADAVHSLSDLGSDVVTLFSLRAAARPPDADHPYGHERYETLGAAFLAAVLLGAAGAIGWDAWGRFDTSTEPALMTLWAAALSIGAKEALYHVTVRVGRACNSPLVVANAWHHRSDALSSVAALAGIAGARMGFPILDPIAAIAVAALIAKMGFELLVDVVHEVTDRGLQREILSELERGIRALPGVVNLHEMRTRRMGPRTLVDLHVEVDGWTTVSDGHQVAERVRQYVSTKLGRSSEVLVHVDPEPDQHLAPGGSLARPRAEIEADARRIAAEVSSVRGLTHVLAHYLGGRVVLQVDIEVDPELRVQEAAAVARSLRRPLEGIRGVDRADIHLELDDLPHAGPGGPPGAGE